MYLLSFCGKKYQFAKNIVFQLFMLHISVALWLYKILCKLLVKFNYLDKSLLFRFCIDYNGLLRDESILILKDQQIAKLSQQNDSLKKQLSVAQNEMNEFEQQIKKLSYNQQQFESVTNEKNQCQHKLELSRQQTTDLNESKLLLVYERNKLEKDKDLLSEEIRHLKSTQLENEYKKLNDYKNENMQYKERILMLEKSILSLKIENINNKRKLKLRDTSRQIEIAISEGAKAESLLLCCKRETVNKDGQEKDFSFLKFLQTNLSDKAVNQLFSKFKKDSIDATQLLSLLTLTVIIYKVKLHQVRSGDAQKPKIDSNKMKKIVQHLSVYIVIKYGTKKSEKEEICVKDDDGQEIKGYFYGYQFSATKSEFACNISAWIKSYIQDQGNIHIQME